MNFDYSPKVNELRERVAEFMSANVYPNEAAYTDFIAQADDRWTIPPIMEEMKVKAREAGLWNLFLPESDYGAGLTNLEYAPLAELMGRSLIAPEAFNCAAPDTGNMEVLVRYGSDAHKQEWLEPLLRGEIRSATTLQYEYRQSPEDHQEGRSGDDGRPCIRRGFSAAGEVAGRTSHGRFGVHHPRQVHGQARPAVRPAARGLPPHPGGVRGE